MIKSRQNIEQCFVIVLGLAHVGGIGAMTRLQFSLQGV